MSQNTARKEPTISTKPPLTFKQAKAKVNPSQLPIASNRTTKSNNESPSPVDNQLINKYEHEIDSMQQTIIKQLNTEKQRNQSYSTVISQNQTTILTSCRIAHQVNHFLLGVQKALQADTYPIELFRNFKLVHEGIHKLTNKLKDFKGLSRDFDSKRDNIFNELIKTATEIPDDLGSSQQHSIISTDSLEVLKRNGSSRQLQQSPSRVSNRERDSLQNQISRLQQKQREDNDEFIQEIRKYNSLLFQLQADVSRLEKEVTTQNRQKMEMAEVIERLYEQKRRDQMAINNLTRKLRGQRNSGQMYHSPQDRTTGASPYHSGQDRKTGASPGRRVSRGYDVNSYRFHR